MTRTSLRRLRPALVTALVVLALAALAALSQPGHARAASPGPVLTPSATALSGTLGDPTDPTLAIAVADSAADPSAVTVTAASSNPAVVPQSGLALSGSGASRTLTVTPAQAGTATITLTATDPAGGRSQTTVAYGASPFAGGASDRYADGISDISASVPAGDGDVLAADSGDDTIRLFATASSGPALAGFSFAGQLPGVAAISAAARVGDTIYWVGSLAGTGAADDVVFATTVSGTGAQTTLTWAGDYTGLRGDLLAWDAHAGNPLGLAAATSGPVPSASGLQVSGLVFAPGSYTTADLAFRGPLQGGGDAALLVPITDLPSLIGAAPGAASFGAPIELGLGGLAIRDIAQDADGQDVILAGTADASDTSTRLWTWSGAASAAPQPTQTAIPSEASDDWTGILALPSALLRAGATVQLVQDDDTQDWYATGQTGTTGLAAGLQKTLMTSVTVPAPARAAFTTPVPSGARFGGSAPVAAQLSTGGPATVAVGPGTTGQACTMAGGVVHFAGVGHCVLVASGPAGSASASQSFTVDRATQAVAFAPASSATVGATQALTATGGASGQPVTFAVSPGATAGVCAVSGTTVRFTGAGRCELVAAQAGTADYLPASEVQRTVTVAAAAHRPVPTPTPIPTVIPRISLGHAAVTTRHGRRTFAVRLHCASGPCVARLTLRARVGSDPRSPLRTVATARVRLAAGAGRTVTLTLHGAAARATVGTVRLTLAETGRPTITRTLRLRGSRG